MSCGGRVAVNTQSQAISVKTRGYPYVRSKLLNREEIAFLDVREEAPHAEGHPPPVPG